MIARICLAASVVLLVISIAVNVYFLSGRGISIDKSTHLHNEQFQGQLQMNLWLAQGDKVDWLILLDNKDFKAVHDALMALPPQESYFAKIFYKENGWTLIVPRFAKSK